MSDYRLFQLLNYLTAYPAKWRELQGLPLPDEARRNPRRRWLASALRGALAWLGRRMVAAGEGLQARYGRSADAAAQPVSNWPGVAL